jgi:hypothetical protein
LQQNHSQNGNIRKKIALFYRINPWRIENSKINQKYLY